MHKATVDYPPLPSNDPAVELEKIRRSSTKGMKYWVSFSSPFFVVRVKLPGCNHWQLVRSQESAVTVNTPGMPTLKVHAVMVFSSATHAVQYCTKVLGLTEQSSPATRSALALFFHDMLFRQETVEELTSPTEIIEVRARNEIKPVLYTAQYT